jgi:hypothetical protein
MLVDTGGDSDIVTGLTRRNRELQTVRDEVPILSDQEQQSTATDSLR